MNRILLLLLLSLFACGPENRDPDPVIRNKPALPWPEGAEAMSLRGQPFFPAEPDSASLVKLAQAQADFERDTAQIDHILWLGRRTAYLGRYREAIRIYTQGIERYPEEPRLYRHRGHRYISMREFDRAILDLQTAARLVEGQPDQVEPDGLPNAQNVPLSTLHTNIWYHLGLAHYLKGEWPEAFEAYQRCRAAGSNDDNWVSATHWLYMILRRMGQEVEAGAMLKEIRPEMEIIENVGYHRLCLFYKGLLTEAELLGEGLAVPANDAVRYGLANWYLYNGRETEAQAKFAAILQGDSWSSFGYIAAEAEYVRMTKE